MPVQLRDLSVDKRTISIPIGDDDLQVTYRPGRYTPVVEDQLRGQFERARPGNGLAAALTELVVEWDLINESGQAIGISVESLRELPVQFLTQVTNAITADMRPKRDERKNFGGGSQREESRGGSLSGTH